MTPADRALCEEALRLAEAATPGWPIEHGGPYRSAFASLWSEINGRESWDANPWVWVIGFARVTA